jgi:hypothetical protein
MKSRAQESLKSGIVFAAVGVVLALTVPPLLASAAATMGLAAGGLLGAATVTGVLGSTLVFGGFGMLYPRVKSWLAPASLKQQPDSASQSAAARGLDPRQQEVDSVQAPERVPQNASAEPAKATFCQKLDADRSQRKAADSLGL